MCRYASSAEPIWVTQCGWQEAYDLKADTSSKDPPETLKIYLE